MTVPGDATINPATPITPKKFTLLPLLTVLFLLSYGLMTMLIVEQGTTIESQRGLIRDMLRDSVELAALKGKIIQEKNKAAAQRHAGAQAQTPSTKAPATSTPSTQTPSAQVPMAQAPSSQVAPNHAGRSKGQKRVQIPERPASDMADERRAVMMI